MELNNHSNSQRYKDVLFALAAASEYEQPLARLPLQKLIYLGDVLSLLWREIAANPGFAPYFNGPYDSQIQNAVDALVFRGFARLTELSFRRMRNIESRYELSHAGLQVVKTLTKAASLADDLQLFAEIAKEVHQRGWGNIQEIVYSEPTYDTARAAGESRRLRTDIPSRNLSLQIIEAFRTALERRNRNAVSRRNLVQMFFATLDQYRSSPEWRFRDRTV